MKAFCNKCKKITEFKCRHSIVRSGDREFCEDEVWYCTECNFAPFLKPKPIKE